MSRFSCFSAFRLHFLVHFGFLAFPNRFASGKVGCGGSIKAGGAPERNLLSGVGAGGKVSSVRHFFFFFGGHK
jgi:hypothetical protein